MKAIFPAAALALPILVLMSSPAYADITISGFKSVVGTSFNPPNPMNACNDAKAIATQNANNKGYHGAVTWQRLSADSDCKLTLPAGGAGKAWIYQFEARGTFAD